MKLFRASGEFRMLGLGCSWRSDCVRFGVAKLSPRLGLQRLHLVGLEDPTKHNF